MPDIIPKLVSSLLDPKRYPHAAKRVKLIETHISWVLLAGRYAYKIKKDVRLDFLDFSSLKARLFYCNAELRLNSRLAKEIYIDVVPIGGSPENPVIGAYPAIEHAVRMKRFPLNNTFDRLAKSSRLLAEHLDLLADKIASFHGSLAPAEEGSGYGKDMIGPIRKSLDELRHHADEDVSLLEKALAAEYAALEEFLSGRLKAGYVRECHGDLHLGNIVLFKGKPVPFDCIEFDPRLRWIDVMNEIAFPVMDLLHHERPDLALRFLNAYLERTGDYAGLKAFRFFLSGRASVRAMVDAVRGEPDACRSHLTLAAKFLERPKPFLIITHGLPGSGKTTFSQIALQKLQAVRIRSDVERKRIAGLSLFERSGAGLDSGIYAPEASRTVYTRLLVLAKEILDAGFPVVVDAAFLDGRERKRFKDLAGNLAVPFAIASMRAERAALIARIMGRRNDASDADLAVFEAKEASLAPLSPEELALACIFADASDPAGWHSLERHIEPSPALC